jgi:hypothetical protein
VADATGISWTDAVRAAASDRGELVPDFIRQHELAVRYPVFSDAKWRRLVRSGELPSTRIGRSVIVATTDVDALLTGRSTR